MSLNIKATTFARYLLRLMSDQTFLSAIESMDFVNQYISIRSGYWKLLISFLRNNFDLTGLSLSKLCFILKESFIERFSECSSNNIKSFFLVGIKKSFYDFKNLIHYVYDIYHNGDIKKRLKHCKTSRVLRHFEKKAKTFYLIKNQIVVEATEQFDQQHEVSTDDSALQESQPRINFHDGVETEFYPESHNDLEFDLLLEINTPESKYFNTDLFDLDNMRVYDRIISHTPEIPFNENFNYVDYVSENPTYFSGLSREPTNFVRNIRNYHIGEYGVVEGWTDTRVTEEGSSSTYVVNNDIAFPSIPDDVIN